MIKHGYLENRSPCPAIADVKIVENASNSGKT